MCELYFFCLLKFPSYNKAKQNISSICLSGACLHTCLMTLRVLEGPKNKCLFNQVDMHSVHFHGQILTTSSGHTDTISLFPGSSITAEMTADNPGHWLLTCTVNDHLMGRVVCFGRLYHRFEYGNDFYLFVSSYFPVLFCFFSWHASYI